MSEGNGRPNDRPAGARRRGRRRARGTDEETAAEQTMSHRTPTAWPGSARVGRRDPGGRQPAPRRRGTRLDRPAPATPPGPRRPPRPHRLRLTCGIGRRIDGVSGPAVPRLHRLRSARPPSRRTRHGRPLRPPRWRTVAAPGRRRRRTGSALVGVVGLLRGLGPVRAVGVHQRVGPIGALGWFRRIGQLGVLGTVGFVGHPAAPVHRPPRDLRSARRPRSVGSGTPRIRLLRSAAGPDLRRPGQPRRPRVGRHRPPEPPPKKVRPAGAPRSEAVGRAGDRCQPAKEKTAAAETATEKPSG